MLLFNVFIKTVLVLNETSSDAVSSNALQPILGTARIAWALFYTSKTKLILSKQVSFLIGEMNKYVVQERDWLKNT